MDINDIARQAGVSRATVSRYLNDGYVSQEKRRLIQRVIEATGYVPSRSARELRTGKNRLVAVIIPKINSQSVSRMVAGITEGLSAKHYHAILADTNNNFEKEITYLNMFAGRRHVDGVILIATVITEAHLKAIEALSTPFVVLGQELEGYPCVFHDDYGAMHNLTRLVLAQAKRPAYLGVFDEDHAAGHQRHLGFLDACAEMGIPLATDSQQVVDFDSDSGYFGAERIIEAMPDVDTIICATDDIAFGAMMCMREYGRRIPEDVQIAGIGDSMLSRIIHPSLTTVHLAYKTSGMEAARMLLAQLENSSHAPTRAKMGYQVYARNTIR